MEAIVEGQYLYMRCRYGAYDKTGTRGLRIAAVSQSIRTLPKREREDLDNLICDNTQFPDGVTAGGNQQSNYGVLRILNEDNTNLVISRTSRVMDKLSNSGSSLFAHSFVFQDDDRLLALRSISVFANRSYFEQYSDVVLRSNSFSSAVDVNEEINLRMLHQLEEYQPESINFEHYGFTQELFERLIEDICNLFSQDSENHIDRITIRAKEVLKSDWTTVGGSEIADKLLVSLYQALPLCLSRFLSGISYWETSLNSTEIKNYTLRIIPEDHPQKVEDEINLVTHSTSRVGRSRYGRLVWECCTKPDELLKLNAFIAEMFGPNVDMIVKIPPIMDIMARLYLRLIRKDDSESSQLMMDMLDWSSWLVSGYFPRIANAMDNLIQDLKDITDLNHNTIMRMITFLENPTIYTEVRTTEGVTTRLCGEMTDTAKWMIRNVIHYLFYADKIGQDDEIVAFLQNKMINEQVLDYIETFENEILCISHEAIIFTTTIKKVLDFSFGYYAQRASICNSQSTHAKEVFQHLRSLIDHGITEYNKQQNILGIMELVTARLIFTTCIGNEQDAISYKNLNLQSIQCVKNLIPLFNDSRIYDEIEKQYKKLDKDTEMQNHYYQIVLLNNRLDVSLHPNLMHILMQRFPAMFAGSEAEEYLPKWEFQCIRSLQNGYPIGDIQTCLGTLSPEQRVYANLEIEYCYMQANPPYIPSWPTVMQYLNELSDNDDVCVYSKYYLTYPIIDKIVACIPNDDQRNNWFAEQYSSEFFFAYYLWTKHFDSNMLTVILQQHNKMVLSKLYEVFVRPVNRPYTTQKDDLNNFVNKYFSLWGLYNEKILKENTRDQLEDIIDEMDRFMSKITDRELLPAMLIQVGNYMLRTNNGKVRETPLNESNISSIKLERLSILQKVIGILGKSYSQCEWRIRRSKAEDIMNLRLEFYYGEFEKNDATRELFWNRIDEKMTCGMTRREIYREIFRIDSRFIVRRQKTLYNKAFWGTAQIIIDSNKGSYANSFLNLIGEHSEEEDAPLLIFGLLSIKRYANITQQSNLVQSFSQKIADSLKALPFRQAIENNKENCREIYSMQLHGYMSTNYKKTVEGFYNIVKQYKSPQLERVFKPSSGSSLNYGNLVLFGSIIIALLLAFFFTVMNSVFIYIGSGAMVFLLAVIGVRMFQLKKVKGGRRNE